MAFVIYLPPVAHSVHFPLALLTTQEWGFAQPGLQQFVNCVLAVVFSSFVINVHESLYMLECIYSFKHTYSNGTLRKKGKYKH